MTNYVEADSRGSYVLSLWASVVCSCFHELYVLQATLKLFNSGVFCVPSCCVVLCFRYQKDDSLWEATKTVLTYLMRVVMNHKFCIIIY